MITYPVAIAVFIAGVAVGMVILSFFVGGKHDVFSNTQGELDTPGDRRSPHPDSALLDYLERSEHNIYFNDKIEASGVWGVLNKLNKLVATGYTVRTALQRAQENDLVDTHAVFSADALATPKEAAAVP